MKRISTAVICALFFLVSACNKAIDEDVRSQVVGSYLSTPKGFQDGVNAAYSSLRNIFCAIEDNGIIPVLTTFGTDTYTNGFDGGFKMLNTYNSDLNPRNNAVTFNWNNLYTAINTCNAVITRAPEVALPDATKNTLVGEVKFIRAQYYFLLVQLWGAIPLPLTETQGIILNPTRAPVKDVYDAIVADLTFSIQNLPVTAANYGRVTKPAAENLLAYVYLARGGSSVKQADDYMKAAALAKGVINNYSYKLLDDFAKVFEQGSGEKNAEVVFAIQNNRDVISNGLGNSMHLYFIMKYDDLPGMQRDIANGRPYARYKPTDFVLNNLFNRQFDSRYIKSFKRVFYCNKPGTYTINGNSVNMKTGDTALYLADREYSAAELNQAKYNVWTPSKQNERVFPTLTKFLDPLRASVNDIPGSRDLLLYRLADTYLIAAEALMMSGNNVEAATYVNTVRRRAANTGNSATEAAANRLAMEISPAQLDIDFILDERARELLGEGQRWIDLARTGKLVERVKKYNPVAAVGIQPFHVLRPIPQDQIDRTTGGLPQNPGYN